mmetsp:Transcript_6821/g.10993  ORF Transcript_6821/g.10993 Transcript_6821/m.10993 type:complete len:465 (-) Transcript_6821:3998-5392(-)
MQDGEHVHSKVDALVLEEALEEVAHKVQGERLAFVLKAVDLLVREDELDVLLFLVPLFLDSHHVLAHGFEDLLQVVCGGLALEQALVATVEVAVRDVFQDGALEGPQSAGLAVEVVGRLHIDDFLLALLFGHVTLAFAAHAHQVEADNDVEHIDLELCFLLAIGLRILRSDLFFRQARFEELAEVGEPLVGEQVDQVVLRDVSREVNHDLLLVGPDQLVLELAEHFEQLQVESLLGGHERGFFCGEDDLAEDLGDVERKEPLVVLEHLVNEQADQRVLVDVAQEDLDVVVHFHLVLEVARHEVHQEVVALVDQLLVHGVVDRVAVHSVLDEVHRHLLDSERTQQPLVLLLHCLGLLFEQHEIRLADLAASDHHCRALVGLRCELSIRLFSGERGWLQIRSLYLWGLLLLEVHDSVFVFLFLYVGGSVDAAVGEVLEDAGDFVLDLVALLVAFVQPLVCVFFVLP